MKGIMFFGSVDQTRLQTYNEVSRVFGL